MFNIKNSLRRIKKIRREYLKGINKLVVRNVTDNIVEQRRRHCSAISLTAVMLCVCTKRVCVCNTELVCKAVRLPFSCQTRSATLSSYSLIYMLCLSVRLYPINVKTTPPIGPNPGRFMDDQD